MLRKFAVLGAAITTAAGLGMSTPAEASRLADRSEAGTVQMTCTAPIVVVNGTVLRLFHNITENDSTIAFVCTLIQEQERSAPAAEASETTSTTPETQLTEAEGAKAAQESAEAEGAKAAEESVAGELKSEA